MGEPGEGLPSHAPKRCCDVAAIVPQSRPLIETFSEMPDFRHNRGNRRALFSGNDAPTWRSLNRIGGVIVQWTAQTDQGWMRHDAHTPARVCFISNQLIPLWNSSVDRPISPPLLLLVSFQRAPLVASGLHTSMRPGMFGDVTPARLRRPAQAPIRGAAHERDLASGPAVWAGKRL